jgi:hypothetical protein
MTLVHIPSSMRALLATCYDQVTTPAIGSSVIVEDALQKQRARRIWKRKFLGTPART